MRPLTRQTREHVGQLGEFDLSLGLFGLGSAGENVEDETAAIDDFAADHGLEIAGLRG